MVVKQSMDLLELLCRHGMDGDVDFLREALRVLVDGIIPLGGGGQDNIDNLQLLRTHCNRVKRDWPQEYLNQYQGGMCISRVLKTTERTLILQPQISSRPLLDRRRYLTIPVWGLLQFAPQPQTNGTFGE